MSTHLKQFKIAAILMAPLVFLSFVEGTRAQELNPKDRTLLSAKEPKFKEELILKLKPSFVEIDKDLAKMASQRALDRYEIVLPSKDVEKRSVEVAVEEGLAVSKPQAEVPAKLKKQDTKKAKGKFQKEVFFINLPGVKKAPKKLPDIFTLKDCIDIAISNHLPLQIANKSIKLAEMRLFEARRNMLPTAALALENYNGMINGRKYQGAKRYIEGQQTIFDGGTLFYTMKQAEANLEIMKNSRAKTRNELILQVKKAYYTLAKAKENLALQEILSREVARIFDIVKRQLDAGITSKLEFLNVSSQTGQVRYQLTSAEGDLSVAGLILKQVMNVDLKEEIEVKTSLEFNKIAIDFEKALRVALLNRPEMRVNLLMMEYYSHGRAIAKSKGWPKIDLIGSWGLAKENLVPEDRDYTGLINVGDDARNYRQQYYAGIKTSMPFWGSTAEYSWTKEQWVPVVSAFQGTETTTNLAKIKLLDKMDYYSNRQLADIDFDKARQETIKIKQDITIEIREGCFNYEKALVQLETASNKVKYQEKDFELTKMKRGMDEAQDSNVIESMIKLTQEKFGYVQALTDCNTSLAGINKAIGIEDYFTSEKISDTDKK